MRADIPALVEGAAHFDGPGGTQVAAPVAAAIAAAMTSAVSNRGRTTKAERRADDIVTAARAAAADLVGGVPDGIAFGRSMTEMCFSIAAAAARDWQPGDEIVVTSLDHDANVTPWTLAASAAGAVVKTADFDARTGELLIDSIVACLSERTRLVAVTGASNLIGTRPEIPLIAAKVHEVGAVLAVDGVHLTPHAPVDVTALGADLYFCSAYKFCGPHLGLVAASPELLESLHPRKLAVSGDYVPERFELGTLPYELLAGLTAGIDWLASIVDGEGDRRARLIASMTAVEQHEAELHDRLELGLRSIEGVRLHGELARSRTPTTLFTVGGVEPVDVYSALATVNVNAPAGHFYARAAAHRLGLGDAGGVRAGLAPYTNSDDVDRLLNAVSELAG